jgi:hypothetical protein
VARCSSLSISQHPVAIKPYPSCTEVTCGTMLVFRQSFSLENAIGAQRTLLRRSLPEKMTAPTKSRGFPRLLASSELLHACDQACHSSRGSPLFLPFVTINHAATLKVSDHELCRYADDVTQHHKPCRNTTMNPVTALMTSHNTINHATTLKANDHELCHCTDDVTQHYKPCCNTEGL